MKYYQSIIFVIVLLFFAGCYPYPKLSDEEKEKIFEHALNLNKQEIKVKLLTYLSENTNSAKSVIQVNEDGLLSGIVSIYLGKVALGLTNADVELSFIVKYYDNNYKIKVIVKDLLYDGKSVHENNWGQHREEIIQSISNFDKSVYSYLSNIQNF